MKLFTQARKYGAKITAGVGSLVALPAAFAQEATPSAWETIFAAIGITGIAAAVIVLMVGVIGIAMAFKGGQLGKRAVRMV